MHAYRDIAGITRAAAISLWVYMALETLFGIARLYAYPASIEGVDTAEGMMIGYTAVATLLSLAIAYVLVGRWIYRASANAHSLSEAMTISPGWSVGWYFIPIANLFKPYQAMKETWLASHSGAYVDARLLPWWWGLWIVTNVLGNISMRMELDGSAEQALGFVTFIDVTSAALNVPLCLILIRILNEVAEAQKMSFQASTFA